MATAKQNQDLRESFNKKINERRSLSSNGLGRFIDEDSKKKHINGLTKEINHILFVLDRHIISS